MKILPVEVGVISCGETDGRRNRETDVKKLIVVFFFRNFADAPADHYLASLIMQSRITSCAFSNYNFLKKPAVTLGFCGHYFQIADVPAVHSTVIHTQSNKIHKVF